MLGLWGGLAPFVGPYFHFGFTPDRAWAYNSARLYYSIAPGAAALLGGALVLVTRNRAVGVAGGLLAVLGGAWFGLGTGFVTYVLKQLSISVGAPIAAGLTVAGGGAAPLRAYLEQVTLFSGLGLLVVCFGALAVGRFSMLAAKDVAADAADDPYASSTIPVRPLPSRVVAAGGTPFPSDADQYSPTGTFTRPASTPPTSLFPDAPTYSDVPTEFGEPT